MFGFLKRLFGGRSAEAQARAESRARAEASGETASASVFVSSDPSQGVNLEEAAALQREAMARIDDSDLPVSQKINAAARLLVGGAFREAIAAYEEIMRLHPETTADCEGQIGAAYFFLKDYETAIDYYERALANGADPSMMRDNIEEAEQAIAERDGGA